MFSLSAIILFISSSIILTIAPGPDIIFLITQGIAKGRKAGVFTAIGLALGNSVHTTAAALGLSVIFKTSEIAFVLLKTFGAIYLIYLAYKAIRHRNEPITANPESQDTKANHRALILRGFYMNVLNPKVALFFLAFLPQFVDPAYNISIPMQMIILGLIFMAQVAVIFGFIGYSAGSLGNWFLKRPNFTKVMNVVSATIFLGLGIKLLTSTR